jgi:hypothetical protein
MRPQVMSIDSLSYPGSMTGMVAQSTVQKSNNDVDGRFISAVFVCPDGVIKHDPDMPHAPKKHKEDT